MRKVPPGILIMSRVSASSSRLSPSVSVRDMVKLRMLLRFTRYLQ
jgi:hypothetical protein